MKSNDQKSAVNKAIPRPTIVTINVRGNVHVSQLAFLKLILTPYTGRCICAWSFDQYGVYSHCRVHHNFPLHDTMSPQILSPYFVLPGCSVDILQRLAVFCTRAFDHFSR